jgi:hypothetical protein
VLQLGDLLAEILDEPDVRSSIARNAAGGRSTSYRLS